MKHKVELTADEVKEFISLGIQHKYPGMDVKTVEINVGMERQELTFRNATVTLEVKK